MALDTFNPYLFVSAGEQSNKFLTPTYADGIAKFQAQRAQELAGLTVRIDPIQEGTGDPSPDNIRPISGRTGLTVTRARKNLLKNTAETSTGYGVTFTCNADGTVSTSGTSTKNANYLTIGTQTLAAGTYVLSGCPSGGGSTVYYMRANLGSTPSGLSELRLASDYGNGGTFTLTEPTEIVTYIACDSGKNMDGLIFRPMIRLATITDDTYEPYTGTEIPITWESIAGTVYGGTLDVVSGVLTVDWDYIASYDGETLPGGWISDRDVYAEGTTPTTGAEVTYKLAEPVTYQLDPEQIMTLPGFNQVYSDAGPVIDIQF